MSHQEIGIATVHYYLPSLCCPILHADPYRSVIYRQSLAIVHLSVFFKRCLDGLVKWVPSNSRKWAFQINDPKAPGVFYTQDLREGFPSLGI